MKDLKNLADLLNINNQKKDFDSTQKLIIDIIKDITGVNLNKDEVIIKNNVVKIKTDSNKKFIIFLNFDKLTNNLSNLKSKFILEL